MRWVAELVGYPLGEGVFTSGGMVSNLTALLAAREHALPGCRTTGVRGRRGTVYCSQEAHQSVVRAVEVIGLGRDAIRKLPLDDRRRLRPDALEQAIAADRADGVTPVAVIATGGTTLTGAVDALDAVAQVCARHGVWMHVDGAYGVPAAARRAPQRCSTAWIARTLSRSMRTSGWACRRAAALCCYARAARSRPPFVTTSTTCSTRPTRRTPSTARSSTPARSAR